MLNNNLQSVGRSLGSQRTQTDSRGERDDKVCRPTLLVNLYLMEVSDIREDDSNWPKKNIVGKQELEIRIGNDHIAFEVRVHCQRWARHVW